jgi:hypothetical protein
VSWEVQPTRRALGRRSRRGIQLRALIHELGARTVDVWLGKDGLMLHGVENLAVVVIEALRPLLTTRRARDQTARLRMAGERTIDAGTPESRQMAEGVRRAVRCTEALNALPYDDRERIAAAWSELTGQPVDPTLHLIPPVYSDCGLNLRIGRNVFVNQGCRLDDIGGMSSATT